MKTALLLASALAAGAWAAEIAPGHVVRFNTVCARCHEGECSGRLSFQAGAPGAAGHIRRYLGTATEREVEAMFGLLKYMKEHCSQYPLAPNAAGRWGAQELAAWRNPVEGGYFVPLGALPPGERRLRLVLDADAPCSARVTDSRFEVAAEEQSCRGGAVLTFAAGGDEHYLHVQTEATVVRLELD